jgi:hypothetical protein
MKATTKSSPAKMNSLSLLFSWLNIVDRKKVMGTMK